MASLLAAASMAFVHAPPRAVPSFQRGVVHSIAPLVVPTIPPRHAPPILSKAEPPPLSAPLLIVDACVLVLYSLSVSIWMLITNGEAANPVAAMELDVDLREIALEMNSAVSIAFGWCIGGSIGGACDQEWVALELAEHEKAPLGVARLLRGWAIASPLALGMKALGVAAVVLPLGGGLAIWPPGVLLDLGGMLAVILLWRRLLVKGYLPGMWP
ncbi:hypothetical protein AB1Y20_019892 [Prymnesium parvum]|uniref:Uncharacterized protein n=1 Tax=Prymnesium parvum TaxID=97485 RepID=A0AB34JVZ6_PRYPA|mmetsp:Transcript_37444/g.91226  ORF Transcript_37444/g.91226 Transcript_37444/m.91226 type:complete len:214 (+) Transcript_37444:49-690(+)